jgi:hypothetical protein
MDTSGQSPKAPMMKIKVFGRIAFSRSEKTESPHRLAHAEAFEGENRK